MNSEKFEKIAKKCVWDFYNENLGVELIKEAIFVVWSCKTLQNNKCILSTSLSDRRIFEVTFNGDKNEMYVDAYKKELNKCVKVGI